MEGAYDDSSYFTAGIHTSLSAGGGAQQSPAQTGGLPPEAAHPGTGGTYVCIVFKLASPYCSFFSSKLYPACCVVLCCLLLRKNVFSE